MLVFLIAGAIAGILLRIRFKVLVIVPASLLEISGRLPPPWTADETDDCFIVRDAMGGARL